MRTNIVLDDDLVREATMLTGITTKRELVEVAPLASGRLRSVREVEFTYRNAPSPLGNDLITDGSRVGELDAKTLRSGRALLGVMEDEWQISTLQL